MKLSVIITRTGNKELLNSIERRMGRDDEIISFNTNSSNIKNKIDKAIDDTIHDNILIVNTKDNYLSREEYVDMFKKEGIVVSNLKPDKTVGIKSSLKFNKNTFNIFNFKAKNVIEYIEKLRNIMLKEDSNEFIIRKKDIPKKVKKRYSSNKRKETKPEDWDIKPRIMLITDVSGWAWWIKSRYINKYLSQYYNFDIINMIGKNRGRIREGYDIYFTFGYSYIGYLKHIDFEKRVTGITAHRKSNILEPKMRMAHATHANSILLLEELKQIHNNPFYVPNGVDENLFYKKRPIMDNRNEITFGHVGKKSILKNQTTILEPAVNKANVKYNPHYNKYTNKVPHTKMVDIHNNYDVYIACSDEDGTPNGMLEAAACGRPVIINNIGNAPQFIKDGYNGFIVEKKIDSYVDVMRWCKDNPDKVHQMGINARSEIERAWTWELMSKNYMYMFDKILNIYRDDDTYENPARYHI